MESSEENPQLELLGRINNHLVDIKKILVAQSAHVNDALKADLDKLTAKDKYVDGGHSGPAMEAHQKVIDPDNTDIQAGEARSGGGK